ncbi:MAG: hypothetical protein ACK4I8_01030 [Armatimonadota bacterium]
MLKKLGENSVLDNKTAVGHEARRYHHFCQPSMKPLKQKKQHIRRCDPRRTAERKIQQSRTQLQRDLAHLGIHPLTNGREEWAKFDSDWKAWITRSHNNCLTEIS